MVGESTREIFLALDLEDAFSLIESAGASIGKIISSSKITGTIEIKTRYGLQGVKLRVGLIPNERGTTVSIGGFGDDIWGGGARKGTDKLLKAIDQMSAD